MRLHAIKCSHHNNLTITKPAWTVSEKRWKSWRNRKKSNRERHKKDTVRFRANSALVRRRAAALLGILIGLFARKFHSLALGVVFGLGVGLLLAFIVAYMQDGYYFRSCCLAGVNHKRSELSQNEKCCSKPR
jgi:hypothetical protein